MGVAKLLFDNLLFFPGFGVPLTSVTLWDEATDALIKFVLLDCVGLVEAFVIPFV